MEGNKRKLVESQPLKSQAAIQTNFQYSQIPLSDVTVLQSHIETLRPLAPASLDSTLEFCLPANSLYFTDLSNSMLYISFRITDKTGKELADTDKTILTNGIFSTLFSSVSVELNNIKVSGSENFAYNAYLQKALFSSSDERKHQLFCEHFYPRSSANPLSGKKKRVD